MDLLEKTRILSIRFVRYLTPDRKVDYPGFALQLSEILSSNVYVLRRDGLLQGRTQRSEIGYDPFSQFLLRGFLSADFTQRLLSITETYTSEQKGGLFWYPEWKNFFTIGYSFITPVFLAEHWGVLIFYRTEKPFEEDEVTFGQYAATILRMAMWIEEEETVVQEG